MRAIRVLAATALLTAVLAPAARARVAAQDSGGAPIFGPSAPILPPPGPRARGRWLTGFTLTEYWPAPETWFTGRLVRAPGLPGFWRTRAGKLTFPLATGGWSAGRGRRYIPLPGVRFAPGPAKRLAYYGSIAVDPSVIPLGSRVYVPAYHDDVRGGWFTAQDTGGAIKGAHIDVFRPPPATPSDPGQTLTAQRVFVAARN